MKFTMNIVTTNILSFILLLVFRLDWLKGYSNSDQIAAKFNIYTQRSVVIVTSTYAHPGQMQASSMFWYDVQDILPV